MNIRLKELSVYCADLHIKFARMNSLSIAISMSYKATQVLMGSVESLALFYHFL